MLRAIAEDVELLPYRFIIGQDSSYFFGSVCLQFPTCYLVPTAAIKCPTISLQSVQNSIFHLGGIFTAPSKRAKVNKSPRIYA
jgi:hypothetical protein